MVDVEPDDIALLIEIDDETFRDLPGLESAREARSASRPYPIARSEFAGGESGQIAFVQRSAEPATLDALPETLRLPDSPKGWAGIPLWLVAIVVGAALLRLPGLFTDFWLDEVWSWTLVWDWDGTSRISGPLGVFTEVHQDNNNHLVTLWMWASGPYAPLWWYRLPSFLAGTALVALAALVATRWFVERRRLAAGVTAAILGFGLMPVVYSSEARGYMLAACAAACAQLALGRTLDRPGRGAVGLFVASSAMGLLSHVTYLPVFVAHGLWTSVSWIRSPSKGRLATRLLVAFGVPTALGAWLWWVDLSQTNAGGGRRFLP